MKISSGIPVAMSQDRKDFYTASALEGQYDAHEIVLEDKATYGALKHLVRFDTEAELRAWSETVVTVGIMPVVNYSVRFEQANNGKWRAVLYRTLPTPHTEVYMLTIAQTGDPFTQSVYIHDTGEQANLVLCFRKAKGAELHKQNNGLWNEIEARLTKVTDVAPYGDRFLLDYEVMKVPT